MWNNPFNLALIQWLSQFASKSAYFNHAVSYIAGATLFKGIPFIAVLWFFWFRDAQGMQNNRRIFIATLIGCMVALMVARLINNIAPYQPRPFANPALSLAPLSGLPAPESNVLSDWNSFPSDHATLFFALATGIFLISRMVGYLAFLYSLLFISLPRIYLGLHYPTDIIAGALLGIVCVRLCTKNKVEKLYIDRCMKLLSTYPAAFQTALFIVSAEMILFMFDDVRWLIQGIKKYLF